jgi:hypothetical protein
VKDPLSYSHIKRGVNMSIQGSITLNGVSDKELAKIWEFKARDGNKFTFMPNQMQPVNVNNNPTGFTGKYNNVVFQWADAVGLKVVHEILDYLLKSNEQVTAVAQ